MDGLADAERLTDFGGIVLNHERHQILDTLTRRLHRHPQFEVLNAVISLEAVTVVDVLAVFQPSAEVLLHYIDVLKEAATVSRPDPSVAVLSEFTRTFGGHHQVRRPDRASPSLPFVVKAAKTSAVV